MRKIDRSKREERGSARVLTVERRQVELRVCHLDEIVPEEHEARAVWRYVEGLDLSALYSEIRSVEGGSGRSAIDPRILMALWLYATLKSVGSARALARLCEEHTVYQWICGGVGVNHHTLSDFRDGNSCMDELLTQSVAVLMREGLVELTRVAQDGLKVRASAGAKSFRRRKGLAGCLADASRQVRKLRAELGEDPGGVTRRQAAARQRAAVEREERIREALATARELENRKRTKKEKKRSVRVSTTDPDARVMKMADGGFRPAYNVQLATDTGSQVIVGVEVTNLTNDHGQLQPMFDQIEKRHAVTPAETLVDGGYVSRHSIESMANRTTVYAPVHAPNGTRIDPYRPTAKESEAVVTWRSRMKTPRAKKIYKERAATAECVNAQARQRGLQQFLVRGIEKAKTVVLWYALAHNLRRAMSFGLLKPATS